MLFFLGLAGLLRAVPLVAVLLVFARWAWPTRFSVWPLVLIPALLLALYPPIAFDETLYHLPYVHEFAKAGALVYAPEVRFPVFPVLQELLCVPAFLLGGDVATHLVSLLEVFLTAAILIEWAGHYDPRAGRLAMAILLGSPLVIFLASVLYVDAALMLFVTAGFYALDRERYWEAGLFFGTACGVKYHGGYFAIVALILVARRGLPAIGRFCATCAAAALPMTAWIYANTGDPVFPFLHANQWTPPPMPAMSITERAVRIIRVSWDATFVRSRTNFQAPVTPFLIICVVLILIAAWKNVQARIVALLSLGYLVIFTFLPQDSRYLVPLLPLVSITAAVIIAKRWPKAVTVIAIIAIAPGMAYAGYCMIRFGVPDAHFLENRVPEYRALQRAGKSRVYVCGAEYLKSYAAGELVGDVIGPYSFERVLGSADTTSAIARRLQPLHVEYFLVAKRFCKPPRRDGDMELVYEDGAAQLWRLTPIAGARDGERRRSADTPLQPRSR